MVVKKTLKVTTNPALVMKANTASMVQINRAAGELATKTRRLEHRLHLLQLDILTKKGDRKGVQMAEAAWRERLAKKSKIN